MPPTHPPPPSPARSIPGPAPCVSYSGKLAGLEVHAVWNGRCDLHNVDYVGTVPAALASYLAVQAFDPDLVISAGTAGGFKSRVRLRRRLLWPRAPRPATLLRASAAAAALTRLAPHSRPASPPPRRGAPSPPLPPARAAAGRRHRRRVREHLQDEPRQAHPHPRL